MNRVENFNNLVRKLNASEPKMTPLQEVSPKTKVSESDLKILESMLDLNKEKRRNENG